MADTDLLGIVSLLLAAGGAAYLLRARFAAQARPANEEVMGSEGSNPLGSAPASGPGRSVPPNVRTKAPEPVAADAEPTESENVKKPKPPEKGGPEEKSTRDKVEKSTPSPEKSKPPLEKPKPPEKATPEKPQAAPEKPKATPEKPKAIPEKAKAPEKPRAESRPEPPKDKPPSSAKVPKIPDPKVAAASSKQSDEAEKARRKAEAAKKRAAIEAEIPKLDVEEDEDVEPTIVGKVSRREIQPPVDKIVVDENSDKPVAAKLESPVALYVLAETDPGKRRKQNEDSFLVMEKEGLFVVADGMGGHRGGQIASKLAVETIQKAYEAKRFAAEPHKDLPTEASNLARDSDGERCHPRRGRSAS